MYEDSTSHPLTSVVFNESGVLQQIDPLQATAGGTIQVYATDEHAPLLGVRTSTMPVSALPSNPGHVMNPQTGDQTVADPSGRLIHPGLHHRRDRYQRQLDAYQCRIPGWRLAVLQLARNAGRERMPWDTAERCLRDVEGGNRERNDAHHGR